MADEQIRIDIEAKDDASKVIEDVAGEVKELDKKEVEVPVRAELDEATITRAREQLERLDKAGRDAGDGMRQGMNIGGNAVADLTGPLGEASGVASDFGGVIDGARDVVESFGQSVGLSADQVGFLTGTALPIAGVAIAGIAAAVGIWKENQRKAKEEAEKTATAYQDIAANIRAGKAAEAVDDLVKANKELFDSAQDLDVLEEVTRFITGLADATPALDRGLREAAAAAAEANENYADNAEELSALNIQYVDLQAGVRDARDAFSEANGALDEQASVTATVNRVIEDYNTQLLGAVQSTRDLIDAQLLLQGGQQALIVSGDELGDTMADLVAAQQSGTATAEELEQAQFDVDAALLDTKNQVLTYIDELGRIPPDVATAFLAQIPPEYRAELQAFIDKAEEGIDVPVRPQIDWASLARQEAAMAARFGTAVSTTNVTLNLPRGVRGEDVVAAISRHARRNGARR